MRKKYYHLLFNLRHRIKQIKKYISYGDLFIELVFTSQYMQSCLFFLFLDHHNKSNIQFQYIYYSSKLWNSLIGRDKSSFFSKVFDMSFNIEYILSFASNRPMLLWVCVYIALELTTS
jgi:hypothetical protein